MRIVTAKKRSGAHYFAPNLFPDAHAHPRYNELRNYVQGRLVEMAESGELYATDIMNQGPVVRDCAGDVITGVNYRQDFDRMHQEAGFQVPDALQNYRVRLRSIGPHGNIMWKRGRVQTGYYRRDRGIDMVPLYDDEWIDTEAKECDVSLRDAWIALQQYGKYCRTAKKARAQDKVWRFEEVPPAEWKKPADLQGPEADTSTAAKRRGRPPKDEARA